MKPVLLCIFLMILSLSGCATTQKTNHVDSQLLQNKISYLEEESSRRDREILELERELKEFNSRAFVPISINKPVEEDKSSNPLRLPVKRIQIALKNSGYYQGSIDGKIGAQTREAIRKFQKAKGLKADGVVGEKTWEKLKKHQSIK